MNFLANMSFPLRTSAFDAHLNRQDGQEWSQEGLQDAANSDYNTQHAAGSGRSSSLSSTSPPTGTFVFNPYEQLRAFLNAYHSTKVDASRDSGSLNTDNPGFSDPGLSPGSSTPPSSVHSPLGGDALLSFSPPNLAFHDLLAINGVGAHDLSQACQYSIAPSPLPSIQPYSTPSEQPLFQPAALPEELMATANIPSLVDQGLQGIGIDNIGALQGNYLAIPPFPETTALGLYYPSKNIQNREVPPLQFNDASVPSTLEFVPPAPTASSEPRKTRAVSRVSKVAQGKHASARADKTRPADVVASSNSTAAGGASPFKCHLCGFPQSTQRKGDFRRHLRIHEDGKLTRYVCCGVPATHPGVASLPQRHTSRSYGGCEFYGGCGKSYSRMDALQRHLGRSSCVGGSARDHEAWRELYL